MTPIIFSFYILCVVYSGGEDCTYTWETLEDEEFNKLYDEKKTKNNTMKTEHVGGFVLRDDSMMVVRAGMDASVYGHEARHVQCNLEYKDNNIGWTELQFCHFEIDLDYLVPKKEHTPQELPNLTVTPKIENTMNRGNYN